MRVGSGSHGTSPIRHCKILEDLRSSRFFKGLSFFFKIIIRNHPWNSMDQTGYMFWTIVWKNKSFIMLSQSIACESGLEDRDQRWQGLQDQVLQRWQRAKSWDFFDGIQLEICNFQVQGSRLSHCWYRVIDVPRQGSESILSLNRLNHKIVSESLSSSLKFVCRMTYHDFVPNISVYNILDIRLIEHTYNTIFTIWYSDNNVIIFYMF